MIQPATPYTNHGWHSYNTRGFNRARLLIALADERAKEFVTATRVLRYSPQADLLLILSREGKLISIYTPKRKQKKRIRWGQWS